MAKATTTRRRPARKSPAAKSVDKSPAAKAIEKAMAARDRFRHLLVNAGAGTGKTYTLEAICNAILYGDPRKPLSTEQQAIVDAVRSLFPDGPPRYITVVAFSKAIATELGDRLPRKVKTGTMHSFGYSNIKFHYRLRRLRVTDWKVRRIVMDHIWKKQWEELNTEELDQLRSIDDIASKCKVTLAGYDTETRTWNGPTDNEMEDICDKYGIGINGSKEAVFDTVRQVLDINRDLLPTDIDFNDMIWLPIVCELNIFQSDLLMVDESQDLNAAQQEMSIRMGKHRVYVGDRNQAIFGFAGADAQSFDTLLARSHGDGGALELPLMTTRRCGKAIVRHAQQWVPDYRAYEGNHDGEINNVGLDKFDPGAGDMVLCRTNAPLLSLAYKWLAIRKPFIILGRDFANGLYKFLKSFKLDDATQLLLAVEEWGVKEEAKLLKRPKMSQAALQGLKDKLECISILCTHHETLDEIKTTLDEIFGDAKDANGKAILSSCHKAKGLEAENIWIINPHLMPHPMAEQPWEQDQEDNLCYVAATRAIQQLYYVIGDTMTEYQAA